MLEVSNVSIQPFLGLVSLVVGLDGRESDAGGSGYASSNPFGSVGGNPFGSVGGSVGTNMEKMKVGANELPSDELRRRD